MKGIGSTKTASVPPGVEQREKRNPTETEGRKARWRGTGHGTQGQHSLSAVVSCCFQRASREAGEGKRSSLFAPSWMSPLLCLSIWVWDGDAGIGLSGGDEKRLDHQAQLLNPHRSCAKLQSKGMQKLHLGFIEAQISQHLRQNRPPFPKNFSSLPVKRKPRETLQSWH